jgi:hypothetical protein
VCVRVLTWVHGCHFNDRLRAANKVDTMCRDAYLSTVNVFSVGKDVGQGGTAWLVGMCERVDKTCFDLPVYSSQMSPVHTRPTHAAVYRQMDPSNKHQLDVYFSRLSQAPLPCAPLSCVCDMNQLAAHARVRLFTVS